MQGWLQAACLPNLAFEDSAMEEDFAQAVAEQCRPVDIFFLAVALVAMPVYFLELLQARQSYTLHFRLTCTHGQMCRANSTVACCPGLVNVG